MAGYKETPRQKMIGMMYLVYTALLAMNVSKDILDAFDTVNTGVQTTNMTGRGEGWPLLGAGPGFERRSHGVHQLRRSPEMGFGEAS